jgi:hypothetical protein
MVFVLENARVLGNGSVLEQRLQEGVCNLNTVK